MGEYNLNDSATTSKEPDKSSSRSKLLLLAVLVGGWYFLRNPGTLAVTPNPQILRFEIANRGWLTGQGSASVTVRNTGAAGSVRIWMVRVDTAQPVGQSVTYFNSGEERTVDVQFIDGFIPIDSVSWVAHVDAYHSR
jgi:hypothetical protein